MKKVILNKLLIEFDTEGGFRNGIILYKLNDNGIISKEYRSLGLANIGYNKLHLNSILAKIKSFVKKTEGDDNE